MKPYSLILLLVAAGCVAPAKLATGIYEEARKPGVFAFTDHTLCLNPDQTFTYAYWSDDLESSRYGAGFYQFANHKLKLVFGPALPVEAQAQVTAGAVQPDSLTLTFLLKTAEKPSTLVPLPGATVLARAATGQVIAGTSSDAAGRATLRLARATQPATLVVSSLGYATWQQACPIGNAAYELQLPPYVGMVYQAGTVKEFRGRQRRNKQLVLAQGKQVLLLDWQAAR